MNRSNAVKGVAAGLLMVAGLAIYWAGSDSNVARAQTTSEADAGPVGRQATIHVRRDLLAGEPLLPIGPTDDRVRGAEISIRGVVRRIDEDWIVLERTRDFAYVPRKSVLVMEVSK